LTNCRALLAPSTWWEPLGLVTYEAYDFKKPMFAAASGGLSETVEHGRTGYLHEPGDARQLAEQVVAFEQLPGSRRLEMGREGRRWLEQNALPSAWHDDFRQILEATLNAS
jgi:glycosyltransferase involved in cell wall biosynthesis